jgi:hypothetical protein
MTKPSALPRKQHAQARLKSGREEVWSTAQGEPHRNRKREHPLPNVVVGGGLVVAHGFFGGVIHRPHGAMVWTGFLAQPRRHLELTRQTSRWSSAEASDG